LAKLREKMRKKQEEIKEQENSDIMQKSLIQKPDSIVSSYENSINIPEPTLKETQVIKKTNKKKYTLGK